MRRVIFHIDVNSAFLSWSAVKLLQEGQPDIRLVPSVVSGDPSDRRSIITAASIPAKKLGIKTAQPVSMALRTCPSLVIVRGDWDWYKHCSHGFIEICRSYSPDLQQFSIDECFIDMTFRLAGRDPVEVATQLKEQIKQSLGFTVNVGVGSNKLLAKMASDFRKPDLVHTLWPEEIPTKMWPLPVRDLFFIGRATERHLLSMGIHTIGEIAKTPETVLRGALKQHGSTVYRFANGIDNEPVIDTPPPNKGYGNSTTISHDVTDAVEAKQVLLHLCDTVGTRLRRDGVRAGVVTVSVRTYDLRWYSHQTVLSTPTNLTTELHSHACRLFDACWDHTPIRSLGVHTARVSGDTASRQLSFLDTTNYEKLDRMDRVVDAIRQRFGKRSVMRASLLPRPSADAAPQTPEADEDTPAEPSST